MKIRYWQYNLPFRYPFTISKGTKTHQPSLTVELEHLGIKGYGEAPAIAYYDITVDKMVSDLEEKRRQIESYALTEPGRFWHYLHHLLPKNPFLVCALDIAAWDIYGKLRGKPLYALWNTSINRNPLTDYTLGIDKIDKMVRKMEENPWPVYKIKLGTGEDLEIVRALRSHTLAPFRVDANAAWELDEALQKIPALESLGVEFIEQPLAKDNWEGMKILYTQSTLPLIADESCVFEKDVENCVGHFHGINIKLTKSSGITPALRMIETARKLNLRVMAGSMNETTIGSAAVAQLLPQLDYADLDGPLLLAEDIATGLLYEEGRVIPSGEPGLGIRFTGRPGND